MTRRKLEPGDGIYPQTPEVRRIVADWQRKHPREWPTYRDPILSDRWLREAEWKATHEILWPRSARKIVLRLIKEVRQLRRAK